MRTGNVLLGLAVSLWLALVWPGRDGTYAIYDQHVVGYPSAGQFDYYVMIPVAVVIALLVLGVICNARKFSAPLKVSATLALAALLPYLLPYTGGV